MMQQNPGMGGVDVTTPNASGANNTKCRIATRARLLSLMVRQLRRSSKMVAASLRSFNAIGTSSLEVSPVKK
jgi:hypothetical protein